MHSIPVGSILLIVFVDLLIIELLSVFFGILIARAGGKSLSFGILTGVLVPMIGPLIWFFVVMRKDTSLASVHRVKRRGPGLYAAAGLLGSSALLFLVATPLPWGSVNGSIEKYSLVGEASAADSGIGLLATVGTALVLVAGVVGILLFTAWRRVALIVAMVGVTWLIVTLDGLISFSAVNHLSRTVDGLSGGKAAAEVAPRGGLYVTLIASVVAIAGATVLGLLRRDHAPAAVSWTSPQYAGRSAGAAPTIRDEF